MSITDLAITPEIAAVGQQVTVAPVGSHTGELRFYLLVAPPSSGLLTLANYAAKGKTLADARLKTTGAGNATFTPDAPGLYRVVVRDVVVYRFVPSYLGEIPGIIPASAPNYNPSYPDARYPATGDNEEADLYADASTTYTQATDQPSDEGILVTVWKADTRSIGFGPDTATLTIKTASVQVADPDLVAEPVTLTGGSTAPAKIAIYDAQVLQVLDTIETSGNDGNLPTHTDLLEAMVTSFNEHIALDTWKTHGIVDPGNGLASPSDIGATLAEINTQLDDIVAKYNAHRIVTAGTVHAAADNTNVMTPATPATLAEAIDYFEHVYETLIAHATNKTAHDASIANNFVDGYFGWLAEPPTTLAEVAQAINGTAGSRWANYGLTHLYEQHRQRAAVRAHATASSLTPDLENSVLYLGGSLQNLIDTANALSDALRRHIHNLEADGAEAGTPYHFTDAKKSRIPRTRAGDSRTLAILIEELWLCLEDHMWSGGPSSGYVNDTTAGTRGQHPDRVWGLAAQQEAPDARQALLIRLQKAFDRALAPVNEPPANVGTLSALLALRAGFS